MLRRAGCGLVVLGVVLAACSSDEELGPAPTPGIAKPTGHGPITLDELESQMLAGVEDESVPMTEAQLDQYFPPASRMTAPEKQVADRDPTKGEVFDVQKAFDAFKPTESADDHFTIDVIEDKVTPADIERVKKGILYGMANWDAFKPVAGFTLTAASSIAKGGKPFKVSIKTTIDPDPNIGWRAYVAPCGGAPAPTNTIPEIIASVDADTCVPRLVLPLETGKLLESLSPFIFVHEMAHVAQSYWQRSAPYLAAGGIKQAGAFSTKLSWQFESDAQYTARHLPDAYAYDVYLAKGCPFEPMRRGAYAWSDFLASKGPDQLLPYQMGLFVDQVTWHRFGKDPAWIYKWLVNDVDPRVPGLPYDATRRLLKIVSKDTTKTDMKTINNVFLQAGVDLYFKGRNPWTTRQLTNDCIRPSASVDLPLLAFDAVRVELGDLTDVAKLRLSLDASRDKSFLKAGVAAVELDKDGKPEFIRCVNSIVESGLSNADPRAGCTQSNVIGLSVLSEKNDYKDEVQLPVTLEADKKYAIIAIVAHMMKKPDAPNTPITATLRAEPVVTPPGNQVAKSQCGGLTEEYRSRCKTKNCFCIGNAYCEATVDPPPRSCEKMQQECYLFCAFQKDECDCSSFCDLLYTRLACGNR